MNGYTLFHAGKMIRRNEEMVRIDFSKPEHRAYVLTELGGLDHLRQAFPELYAHYIEAVCRDSQQSSKPVQVGEPDAFEDAVDIFYGFYDTQKERLICKGVTSIKQNAMYICQRIHVYQENGVLLMATGSVSPDCHHAVLEMDEHISLSQSQANSNLVFDFFSLWYEESNGLQAACYSTEDSLAWNAVDYVQKLTVLDPVHKKTGPDSPIVICYNRTSLAGEQIDYDSYEEAFDPVTNRQRLFLDVGAEVELASEALPFSAVDVSKLLLKLDCQSGIASYQKSGSVQSIMDAFQATEKGFVFHLDKDWKDVVPADRLPMREPVDFLLRVEFQANDYQKRGRFIVESGQDSSKTHDYIVTISQLYFLWGCIADDTPVLMKDGTVKPASQVQIGDQIVMETGTGRVKDVITGREEEPLCCICTKNGRQICCTGLHPVLTRRGFIPAEELTGEDEAVDLTDGFVPITAVYPVRHRDVVNFSVEPEDPSLPYATMVCDHLVVGDYALQCVCTKASTQKPDVHAEPTGEAKKLMEYFGSAGR